MRGSRSLALAFAFAFVSAAASVGCNRILGPTKTDSDWHVFDSVHFSLHARPGSFAEQSAPTLGQVLDDQYDATLRQLDVQYSGRNSGFLYNNAADGGRDAEF